MLVTLLPCGGCGLNEGTKKLEAPCVWLVGLVESVYGARFLISREENSSKSLLSITDCLFSSSAREGAELGGVFASTGTLSHVVPERTCRGVDGVGITFAVERSGRS